MGYPMDYGRLKARNKLEGDYGETPDGLGMIRGDMRRLEQDQRDMRHLISYARRAGITPEQARRVLDDLFGPTDVTLLPE